MKKEDTVPRHIRLLVVVYITPISDSETISSIVRFVANYPDVARHFSLAVWDNSPADRSGEFEKVLGQLPVESSYTSSTDNTRLSEVYNRSIDSTDSYDYLCLLDQDSQLLDAYFLEAASLASTGVNLALPQVFSDDVLFSPSKRRFCLGRHFPSIPAGPRSSKNMLAINSGMLVNRAVFRNVRYDDRVCFYGTDTWFMVRYERHYDSLYVMAAPLVHSLRIKQKNSATWRKNYYETQIKINTIIFDSNVVERVITWMYGLYLKAFYARD